MQIGIIRVIKNGLKRLYQVNLIQNLKTKVNMLMPSVFTEPNGKVYTIDPVTQKKDEIRDDTIVEFTYDKSKKDFHWNPIRVRYDKTEKYKSGTTNIW